MALIVKIPIINLVWIRIINDMVVVELRAIDLHPEWPMYGKDALSLVLITL
jgi:hypothetical protein